MSWTTEYVKKAVKEFREDLEDYKGRVLTKDLRQELIMKLNSKLTLLDEAAKMDKIADVI